MRSMVNDFAFSLSTTRFDEHYRPAESSRATTNFANLARGENRQENLRAALAMIDRRLNELLPADNPAADRYSLELDIVSVDLHPGDDADAGFPLIEVLDTHILDRLTGQRHDGVVGNNFSSYVRDYDFSVLLPTLATGGPGAAVPDGFGDLHGKLFEHFLESAAYRERYSLPPVICISVSTSRTYRRTETRHPVLGAEYVQDKLSLTDEYFSKMGLRARNFMPSGSAAPLAFYFRGDLCEDYSDLQLAALVSTMETFQKIYRPEIYNAHVPAAEVYRPTLEGEAFTRTGIAYDREERSQLAKIQGAYAAEHLIAPYGELLEQWAARRPAPVG